MIERKHRVFLDRNKIEHNSDMLLRYLSIQWIFHNHRKVGPLLTISVAFHSISPFTLWKPSKISYMVETNNWNTGKQRSIPNRIEICQMKCRFISFKLTKHQKLSIWHIRIIYFWTNFLIYRHKAEKSWQIEQIYLRHQIKWRKLLHQCHEGKNICAVFLYYRIIHSTQYKH